MVEESEGRFTPSSAELENSQLNREVLPDATVVISMTISEIKILEKVKFGNERGCLVGLSMKDRFVRRLYVNKQIVWVVSEKLGSGWAVSNHSIINSGKEVLPDATVLEDEVST